MPHFGLAKTGGHGQASSAAARVDPVAFLATAEPRHLYAAAAFVGAMQRRPRDSESAASRLAVALAQHLDPAERATLAEALWRDLDLVPPHPRLVEAPRAADAGAAP